MGQVDAKLCFLDKSRPCPPHPKPCMAWDKDACDCIILMQMRAAASKDGHVTVFPVSAPPPEVR